MPHPLMLFWLTLGLLQSLRGLGPQKFKQEIEFESAYYIVLASCLLLYPARLQNTCGFGNIFIARNSAMNILKRNNLCQVLLQEAHLAYFKQT